MIRMVLIGIAFLAVTITLIIIQPSNPEFEARGEVDTEAVSRAETELDAMRNGAKLYAVRPGDSLASISFRFYGTTEKAPDIFATNVALMGSPRNIAVGQELVRQAQ